MIGIFIRVKQRDQKIVTLLSNINADVKLNLRRTQCSDCGMFKNTDDVNKCLLSLERVTDQNYKI